MREHWVSEFLKIDIFVRLAEEEGSMTMQLIMNSRRLAIFQDIEFEETTESKSTVR